MKKYGLNKSDKLCSSTAIDKLFNRGADSISHCASTIAFPLRAIWRTSERYEGSQVQFLISVPKKRIRHAVDRVQMRRRIREAYRLNRHTIELNEGRKIDLALIYVANELKDYATVKRSIERIFQKINDEKHNSENIGNTN